MTAQVRSLFEVPVAQTSNIARLQLDAEPFALDGESISWLEPMMRRALEPLAAEAKGVDPSLRVRILETHAAPRFIFVHVAVEDENDGTLVAGVTIELQEPAFCARADITIDDHEGSLEEAEFSMTASLEVSPRPSTIKSAIEHLVAALAGRWRPALLAFSQRAS